MLDVVAAVLIVVGTAFLAVSALGLLRFPDAWSRAHAVAKAESLGLVTVVAGLLVLGRFGPGSWALVFLAVFSLVVNPSAIHALAQSAHRRSHRRAADDPDTEEDVAP